MAKNAQAAKRRTSPESVAATTVSGHIQDMGKTQTWAPRPTMLRGILQWPATQSSPHVQALTSQLAGQISGQLGYSQGSKQALLPRQTVC